MIEYTKDQAPIVKAIKAAMGKDKLAQAATLDGRTWRVRAQVGGPPRHAEIHARADVPPLTDLPLAVDARGLRTAGVVVPTSIHLDDVQALSADLREDRSGDKPAVVAGLLETSTLRRALTHAGVDPLRGGLHGVVIRDVDGQRFVAATDTHRGLMLPAPDMTAALYIPGHLARAMVAVAKIAGKAGDGIQWAITTAPTATDYNTRVCVVAEVPTVGTVYLSQVEAYRFPPIEKVYPTETRAAWVDAPAAAALRELLTRAGKMYKAAGDRSGDAGVMLTLDGQTMSVGVCAGSADLATLGSVDAPGAAVGKIGMNAHYLLDALDVIGDADGVTLRFSDLSRGKLDGSQDAEPDGTTIDDCAPVVVTAGAHVDMAGGSIPAGGSVVVMPMRI